MYPPRETRQPYASIALVAIYVTAVVSPLVVAVLAVRQTDHSLASEIAKNCGLVGIGILLIQFVLAARLRFICNRFSLNDAILFHRSMGTFALVLLSLHPVLMAGGESDGSLIFGWNQPWDIWAGKVALLLLLTHVLVSIFRAAVKLSYERWRQLHDILAVLIIGLTLLHSWFAGGDLQTWPMRVLWLVLGGSTLTVFVWHRWIRPRKLAGRPMRVSEVRQESSDVWTLRLEGGEGWTANHLPGQFHFLTFPNSWAVPAEEHHFTIASSPTAQRYLESTIKASGDFTSKIQSIESGDTVVVHGAFGRFSYVCHPHEEELIFIAGGIGITPLMSMLRHMRDTASQKSVKLLCGNKAQADIVFRDELAEMQALQTPPLTVTHILSDADDSWTGETGRIDDEKIDRLLGEIKPTTGIYVCGSEAMTRQVIDTLLDRGMRKRQIHAESFSLMKDTAPTSSSSQRRRRLTVAIVMLASVLLLAVAWLRAGGASADGGQQHQHDHSH